MADKKKVIILIIIIFIFLGFVLLTRAKNCDTDYNCFRNSESKCTLAKVKSENNDNLYEYKIVGRKGNNCIMEITLLSLSQTQPKDLRDALNGRSMKCAVPRDLLKDKTVKEIANINDYCTGTLKEALLQITLDKLYDIIVKNLGQVAIEQNSTA